MARLGVKGTFILFICGLLFQWVFHFPLITSMNGATLLGFSIAGQELNCVQDFNTQFLADQNAMGLDPSLRLDLNQYAQDLSACQHSVDPGKSSLAVAREMMKQ
ncbi:hypothetical protein ACCW76_18770 [Pantoea sp. C8B4]|uniref:hypothetical protein n=1 Tax=Pantoea sp. C8B4 TaxID=3243083 RepID=UPI003EDB2F0E